MIQVIASKENWIEGRAVEQLEKTAQLPGICAAVGMPDLHPGKDAPIGAVFASRGIIYPHLVGNDIGCGMSFWQTDLPRRKLKLEKWAKRLDLDGPWSGDLDQWLATDSDLAPASSLAPTIFDSSLGTIGGGNHFAELQRINEVHDKDHFHSLKLDQDVLFLLVHSGSRGFGESILRAHVSEHKNHGLKDDSDAAREYLLQHDNALTWARCNRKLIAHRFSESLGAKSQMLFDVHHNLVERSELQGEPCWLHRKGAAPSDCGPVMIPGSRGTLSYLVAATGDQSKNLATLAHGAGRKWGRSDCRGRLENRYSKESLTRTDLGGHVICENKDLLFEEAPQAYKDIEIVVQDLVSEGLIKVIASLSPLITYKTRNHG